MPFFFENDVHYVVWGVKLTHSLVAACSVDAQILEFLYALNFPLDFVLYRIFSIILVVF